jgi:hypothetical protein
LDVRNKKKKEDGEIMRGVSSFATNYSANMIRTRHVARMEEVWNSYKHLVGEPEFACGSEWV